MFFEHRRAAVFGAVAIVAGAHVAAAQTPNPFDQLKQMMALSMPVIYQSAVENCPAHFAIADPKAHAAGLAKAKKTFVNPGDYHYTSIKARADNSYKKDALLCDKELKELKGKGVKELLYKK